MTSLWSRILTAVLTLALLLIVVYVLAGPITVLAAQDALTGLQPADRAAALATTRTTVTAILGVAGTLLTAVLTVSKVFAEKDKQRVDRFSAAVDHLLSDTVTGRVGGVWELDQIMDSSPSDLVGARRVLAQFVREFSPRQPAAEQDKPAQTELPGDIAAAVSTASKPRRRPHRWLRQQPATRLDFRNTNLIGAELAGADLENARLSDADLTKADLSRGILTRADLTSCVLIGAVMSHSRCQAANLGKARMMRADPTGADLSTAVLTEAHLTGALLAGADLTKAKLRGAHLAGADLTGARGLTAGQLAGALVDPSTRLPAGIAHPAGNTATG